MFSEQQHKAHNQSCKRLLYNFLHDVQPRLSKTTKREAACLLQMSRECKMILQDANQPSHHLPNTFNTHQHSSALTPNVPVPQLLGYTVTKSHTTTIRYIPHLPKKLPTAYMHVYSQEFGAVHCCNTMNRSCINMTSQPQGLSTVVYSLYNRPHLAWHLDGELLTLCLGVFLLK